MRGPSYASFFNNLQLETKNDEKIELRVLFSQI